MKFINTNAKKDEQFFNKTENKLLDEVIPAVKGEFYSYASIFSVKRPLYFLQKCKSNKDRPLTENVENIHKELNLCFIFNDNDKSISLSSPKSKLSKDLLKNIQINFEKLENTEIKISPIDKNLFYRCFREQKEQLLVDIFDISGKSFSSVNITENMIISVKTDSNKYGLILIKELSKTTCKIDACHILIA